MKRNGGANLLLCEKDTPQAHGFTKHDEDELSPHQQWQQEQQRKLRLANTLSADVHSCSAVLDLRTQPVVICGRPLQHQSELNRKDHLEPPFWDIQVVDMLLDNALFFGPGTDTEAGQ